MEEFKKELERYRKWSKAFKKLSLKDKIIELQKNRDIFTLTVNDEFRWGIKVNDHFIQEHLEDLCEEFEFRSNYITREAVVVLMTVLGLEIENEHGETPEIENYR